MNGRRSSRTPAPACSARIELHVFSTSGYDTLWDGCGVGMNKEVESDYPMTEDELRWAWSVFQPLSARRSSRRSTPTRCTPAAWASRWWWG